MAQTGFDDEESLFAFLELGFNRNESKVLAMLEGHFRNLDPDFDPEPVLVITQCADCGGVSVEDPNESLSDLERVGLLAKGLFMELDEQAAEAGGHDDDDL